MPNRPGRLPGFEYQGFNTYFLTICTHKRVRAFDDREFGRWALGQLLKQAKARNFEVIAYCLMPDHVHLLVRGRSETADLRSLFLSWNTRTAFEWRRRHASALWQSGYTPNRRDSADVQSPAGSYVRHAGGSRCDASGSEVARGRSERGREERVPRGEPAECDDQRVADSEAVEQQAGPEARVPDILV